MPTDFTVIGTYQGFTDTGTTLHISDVATIETDGSYIAEDTPVASGHIFYKLFYIADGKTVTVANNATVHGIGEAPAAGTSGSGASDTFRTFGELLTSEIYRGLFMASEHLRLLLRAKAASFITTAQAPPSSLPLTQWRRTAYPTQKLALF